MQMSVVLQGTLQGMGRTAECSFVAVKTWNTGRSTEARYSDCSVITAPADLPDGIYLLEFENNVTCVERRKRRWLVSSGPVRNVEEMKSSSRPVTREAASPPARRSGKGDIAS